jgi:hypothetical protein
VTKVDTLRHKGEVLSRRSDIHTGPRATHTPSRRHTQDNTKRYRTSKATHPRGEAMMPPTPAPSRLKLGISPGEFEALTTREVKGLLTDASMEWRCILGRHHHRHRPTSVQGFPRSSPNPTLWQPVCQTGISHACSATCRCPQPPPQATAPQQLTLRCSLPRPPSQDGEDPLHRLQGGQPLPTQPAPPRIAAGNHHAAKRSTKSHGSGQALQLRSQTPSARDHWSNCAVQQPPTTRIWQKDTNRLPHSLRPPPTLRLPAASPPHLGEREPDPPPSLQPTTSCSQLPKHQRRGVPPPSGAAAPASRADEPAIVAPAAPAIHRCLHGREETTATFGSRVGRRRWGSGSGGFMVLAVGLLPGFYPFFM